VLRFTADDGCEWEVVAGRESWGAIVAIFIPVEEDQALRQTHLTAASYEEANTELGALGQEALQALLDRATPKTMD